MVVIKNENTDFYDVDGTLILHQDPNNIPDSEKVFVQDSVSGGIITVRIHRPMVRLLRESKSRGAYVVVWSRGGYRWATDVIKALGLQECVNMVMSKPLVYFDDLPAEQWLPHRVYLEPDTIYKQVTKQPKEI